MIYNQYRFVVFYLKKYYIKITFYFNQFLNFQLLKILRLNLKVMPDLDYK